MWLASGSVRSIVGEELLANEALAFLTADFFTGLTLLMDLPKTGGGALPFSGKSFSWRGSSGSDASGPGSCSGEAVPWSSDWLLDLGVARLGTRRRGTPSLRGLACL
jgi:hypothetical protein